MTATVLESARATASRRSRALACGIVRVRVSASHRRLAGRKPSTFGWRFRLVSREDARDRYLGARPRHHQRHEASPISVARKPEPNRPVIELRNSPSAVSRKLAGMTGRAASISLVSAEID